MISCWCCTRCYFRCCSRSTRFRWQKLKRGRGGDAVEGDRGARQGDVAERANAIRDLRRRHTDGRRPVRVDLEPRQQRLGIDDDVELIPSRRERQRRVRHAQIVGAQRRRGRRREDRDGGDGDGEPAPPQGRAPRARDPGVRGVDAARMISCKRDVRSRRVAQSDASSACASGASTMSNVGCPSSAAVTSGRALARSPDAAAIAAA